MNKKVYISGAWIIGIANIVLFAFNLYYLCNHYPRYEKLGFDYIGIIIGILSFLVTLLIGGQLVNFLIFEKRMKELISKEIKNSTDQINDKLPDIKGQFYLCIANTNIDAKNYPLAFHNLLLTFDELYQSKVPSNDEIEIVENRMCYVLKKLKEYPMISFTDDITVQRYVQIAKKINSKTGDEILQFLFNHKT